MLNRDPSFFYISVTPVLALGISSVAFIGERKTNEITNQPGILLLKK